ncbi:hypothetical protein ACMFMG_007085 [Clarireedia jacksonii]
MVPLLSQLMLMIELSPQIAAGSDLFFNYVLLGDTVSVGIRIQLTTEGTTEEGLWKRLRERLQQLFNHIAWDVNNEAIHRRARLYSLAQSLQIKKNQDLPDPRA